MEKSWPKISIITPSFNQGQFLEQTIKSVIEQNYPNLEYIIIDGGSTDNSVEIIKKYASKLKYWISEKDKGQSDAINKGFAHVTGDIVNWLNSDDYLEKGSLLKIAELYLKDPAKSAFIFSQRVFYQHPAEGSPKVSATPVDTTETLLSLLHIDQPATFFRADIFRSLMPLDLTYHFTMDAELLARYLLQFGSGNMTQSPEVIVHFRIHGSGKTTKFQNAFFKEKKTLFACILRSLFYEDEELKRLLDELMSLDKLNKVDAFHVKIISSLDRKMVRERIMQTFMYDLAILPDRSGFRSQLKLIFGPSFLLRKGVAYLWVSSFFK